MEITKEQLAEYELRATMAERERCAKIAEGFSALDGEEDKPVYRARTVGNAIAVSIRNSR